MRKYTILILTSAVLFLVGCASENANQAVNSNTSGNSNAIVANAGNNNAANANKTAANTTDSENAAKFGGTWTSEKINRSGERHTEFSLFITQNGDQINGTYSVVDFIGGEPQVEDGNQTPFIGTITGGAAEIKFDPDNTLPGYEENVKYKDPENGKPGTATLNISGDNLTWKTTSGEISGVPKEVKLKRDKMNKVSEE